MFNKYKPKAKLKTEFDEDVYKGMQFYFLENISFAERRYELLKLATGIDPERKDYNIPEIYDLFNVHDRSYEEQRAIGCDGLPGFWDDGIHIYHIKDTTIDSYESLFELLRGLSAYETIEDEDLFLFQDMLLKICWYMRNYKEAYERISKLDWFRVGVHNSYILDIMPDDKKDDAKEWLEEDIYDDELMNLNRHVLTKYIRNKDVSDYFMCLRFGVDDLSYLIHRGYVDIEEKIESLIWMEKQLNVSEDISKEYEKWSREEFDKAHSDNFLEENCSYFRACLQMTRILYEKVYSLIYGNHDNLLFVIEDYVPKSYDRQEREMFDFHWRENDIGIFKNMRDVMTWFDDHYDGLEDWSYYRYLLSVYSLEAEKPVKIIEGNIEVIDDKLSLYRIYISGDRYSDNPEEDKVICNTLGISSGMLNFYYEVLEYTPFDIEGLKLPYNYGDFLKIKPPHVCEADYGRYYPSMDGNRRWYNWLAYPEYKGDVSYCVDLGYSHLCTSFAYMAWDWLEKVDEVPEDY